jgi:sulfur relay (sulfurtransferase) complex TusBCD TusD component (DsrE family)
MSKIGIIINTNDPEICWNAMRFGLTALVEDHEAAVFLMGAGVEIEGISHPQYNVSQVIEDFKENGGKFMVCGVCQNSRSLESGLCPANVMNDAVNLVVESDKVVVFG